MSVLWYCPKCGDLSNVKVYVRHNGYVPIFYCPKCAEDYEVEQREGPQSPAKEVAEE